ncbi:MAG: CBS domain-containing protein [Staphylothermus sp.]|nr:CBS domain-containing protein [Staphylothermus sp.]
MKARDYVFREVPVIDKNDTLYHAFKLVEKTGIDKIIATENRVIEPGKEVKSIAGIVTSRDIVLKIATERLRLTTPSKVHLSSFMSINPYFVSVDEDLTNVIKVMVEKGYGIVPVVSNDNEVLGGILRDELIKLAEGDDTEVRVIMDTNPLIARTTDRILKIRQDMLNNDISFMPVLDERDELVGYITIYEVAYALLKFQDIVPAKHRKERIMHLIVEDVMRFRPPRLRIVDTVSVAVKEILKKNSRGAVVVDEIGRVAGVITSHIILKYLYERKISG